MLTVLDLFSGIGGISLGLESTGGFKTIAFCEIEAFPREVLRKHWPGVPIHDDVRRLTADSLGGLRPDCIVGGFPCQDISVAGKGAGLDGKRSGLWSEYARLVGELRPRWVLAENVGALRTRGADRVCSDLEGEGYSVWPLLVGAWAAGAPHKRERAWIVGRLDDSVRARQGIAGEVDAGTWVSGQGKPDHRAARASGASELSNSDAGRRVGSGDEVQAGRDKPERTASGVGQADPSQLHRHAGAGQPGRDVPESGDHRGTRGVWPVGSPTGSGLALRRSCPESARAEESQRHGAGSPRWPARPGEPQHEWEEPRLAYGSSTRLSEPLAGPEQSGGPEEARRIQPRRLGGEGGVGDADEGSGSAPREVGGATHGLPSRLVSDLAARTGLPVPYIADWWARNRFKVERKQNRESLKAYGNSVVPQVVEAIGFAILEAERANP